MGIPSSEFTPPVAARLTVHSLDVDYSDLAAYTKKLLQATASQYSTPQSFFERNLYFFRTPARPVWADRDSHETREQSVADALQRFSQIPQEHWNETELKKCFHAIVESVSTQSSQFSDSETRARHDVSRVLRTILLAGNSGPALVDTMLLLGRDLTLKRVKAAAMDLNGQE